MARRTKVLIIEDNQDSAESLQLLLGLHGFEASVAADGPEGLRQARQSAPDIVLCDLGLPGLSGLDVARALRAEAATATALLVCVSGYGQEQDQRQAREAGFNEVLVKPVDPDVLLRLLGQADGPPRPERI